jgi:two-component system LytT family response regulator
MRVLIIEDEAPAARRLERLLMAVQPKTVVQAALTSVRQGIAWLQNNPSPDVILSDIELTDGRCFDIFQQQPPKCPVIFTTAYDAFALEAFDHNGIAYLLKPIEEAALRKAFERIERMQGASLQDQPTHQDNLQKLLAQLGMQASPKSYRERFLLKYGDRFVPLEVTSIAYIYAADKAVFAQTKDGKTWPLDDTLDELEQQLDAIHFFRLNRAVLAHRTAIAQIVAHFNGRLKISLMPTWPEEVYISRERAAPFRAWMNY